MICEQYSSFIVNVIEILERNNTDVKKLRSLVCSYLKINSPELNDKLDRSEDVSDVCCLVERYFTSFLDCKVFKHVLMKFGGDAGRKEWEDYSVHLDEYVRKHKVEEFIKINPDLRVHHSDFTSTVTLKVDLGTLSPLKNILDIQVKFADILDINYSNLVLLDIKEGCVLLTFLIPEFVAETTFAPGRTFTTEQVKALKELSIKWLICDDRYLNLEVNIILTHSCSSFTDRLQELIK